MNISKIHAVYFSPCRSTASLTRAIAEKAADVLQVPVEYYDFTLPKNRRRMTENADFALPKDRPDIIEFSADELVIFGTPTYAGRIPNKILPLVQECFMGNGALAVPVVSFGNRSCDNALLELRNELEKNGFHTVAGGAFVNQHAFTDKLAGGRPDADDMAFIENFAEKAAVKVRDMTVIPEPVAIPAAGQDSDDFEPYPVEKPVGPYYRPLGMDGEPAVFLKASPVTDIKKCSRCGICARVCPMGSISSKDVTVMTGICIKCQACVKRCPDKAKYFDDPAFLSHVAMLEKNYTRRAESKVFF